MLRCLSKFGQITTRPSFNKPVQIRKSLFVQPRLFTRNASGFKSDGALPFSRVYGDKEGEVNSFFPKSDQKDDDFSFINSGLFAGDSANKGFFTPTEDLSKKEYKNYWDVIDTFCENYVPPFEEGHKWVIDGFFLNDGEYMRDKIENADPEEIEESGLALDNIDPKYRDLFKDVYDKNIIPKYHMTDAIFTHRKLVYPMALQETAEEQDDGSEFRYVEIDLPSRTIKFVVLDLINNEQGDEFSLKVPQKWWIHFKKVRWPKGIKINQEYLAQKLSEMKYTYPDEIFYKIKEEQGVQKYKRVNLLLDQEKLNEQQQQQQEDLAEEGVSEEEAGLEEAVDEKVDFTKKL